MEVLFERTTERRYLVEVRRPGVAPMRMDPAPGFDDYFPHDLQHLIVEEQLGLDRAIFGRLAAGGTAATFRPVVSEGERSSTRDVSRARRRLRRRDGRLRDSAPSQFDESERATFVAWQDWLAHCPEPELRERGAEMAAPAAEIVDRMADAERARFERRRMPLRQRIDDVARRWHARGVGEPLIIEWQPVGVRRSTEERR